MPNNQPCVRHTLCSSAIDVDLIGPLDVPMGFQSSAGTQAEVGPSCQLSGSSDLRGMQPAFAIVTCQSHACRGVWMTISPTVPPVIDSVTVSFEVAAAAYDRFMGRYSMPLAPAFADFAGVVEGLRVLDVGCGPGAMTDELVRRVGQTAVAAVDPSDSFLRAVKERYSDADVRNSTAERLPFDDHDFDATVAQLVVHFMDEPSVGLREMARRNHR